MEWYWIVLLTIIGVHFINAMLVAVTEITKSKLDDEYLVLFMCFLVWFPIYIALYPRRALKIYNRQRDYYKKNGISRMAYILGKRR